MSDSARGIDVVRCIGLTWIALGVAACEPGSALDIIAVPETVIEMREVEESSSDPPMFDPELEIIEEFDGCAFRINKSAALTRLTVKDLEDDANAFEGVIFPTRAEALAALGERRVIPSMEVVNGMLKPFNDGLYAAVERLAEDGSGGALVNKRATFDALLQTMLAAAAQGDSAAATAAAQFAVAQQLAGGGPELPPAIQAEAAHARESFESDPFTSTAIGFYTWAPDLELIFRRDRFLQNALQPGLTGLQPAAATARALANHREQLDDYRAVLELYRGLTNPSRDFAPLVFLDPNPDSQGAVAPDESSFAQRHPELNRMPPCQASFSWLPASDSPERKLIAAEWCAGRPPQNLLDALIAAIQSGAIDLTPTAQSGFYDYQLHALETLLLPERSSESRHLLLTQKYRDKLVETFKSLLIQTRETHVKQLGTVATAASAKFEPREVDVYPLLPVEPFPTFYLRTARAYAFLHNFLRSALREGALRSAPRVLEDGTQSPMTLQDELTRKTQLLYGLHLVAAESLGMRDELTADERTLVEPLAAEQSARDWLDAWRTDLDVLRDPRVAVPLVYDAEAQVTQNLAVVGVKVLRIAASFPKGREPIVTQGVQDACTVRKFVPFEPYMLVEQSLEFTRSSKSPPLTRDALRAALSGKRTLDAIRGALEPQ